MLRSSRIKGLREARRKAGLTQQRLADLSGLPRQHVSAMERFNLLLTDERAGKIAPNLGVHPAALVVGHAAARLLRGINNKSSVTVDDFKTLLLAFSAARSDAAVNPVLRLELIRVVREMSGVLFGAWNRLLDDAEREAERALEVRTT